MQKKLEKDQTNSTVWRITDAGKKHLEKILAVKPFADVVGIMQYLNLSFLSESQSNDIIGTLSRYPYYEVADFFAKTNEYFNEINEPENEEIPTANNKNQDSKDSAKA